MAVQTKSDFKNMPLLVSVKPEQTVEEALALMSEYEISEIPVVESDKILGTLRENKVMGKVISSRATLHDAVNTVMEEPMPILDAHEDIKSGLEVLREFPALVVSEFGRPLGVLSRHDVLGYL